MSALVSVTVVEAGVARRLVGAAAYQHLFEQDAAKALTGPARAPRRAVPRPAGGPPSDAETRVLGALAAAPEGLDRYALADRVALSAGGVVWHARRLTARSHVRVEIGELRRKRYHITDAGREALANPDPHSKHGGRMAQVFEWLSQNPGASVAEIAAALDLQAQGLRGVLERLEDVHRVEVLPNTTPRRYRITGGGASQ